jgi:enoyl-CoA hydratase/carnithine racemase
MTLPTFESLLYTRDGQVAVLTFNRPQRMNAIGGTLKQDIAAAIREAERDDAVRAIVLTGAGPAFCAGGDVKEMSAGPGAARPLKEKIAPARDERCCWPSTRPPSR